MLGNLLWRSSTLINTCCLVAACEPPGFRKLYKLPECPLQAYNNKIRNYAFTPISYNIPLQFEVVLLMT